MKLRVLKKLNKEPDQFFTYREFIKATGIPEDDVVRVMRY